MFSCYGRMLRPLEYTHTVTSAKRRPLFSTEHSVRVPKLKENIEENIEFYANKTSGQKLLTFAS